MNMRQMVDESTIDFIESFRKARNHCSVQLLEVEYAAITVGNMHHQLKQKLVAREYSDLSQLASNANRIEQFIHEKELKRANKGRGSHLISLVTIDEENIEAFEEEGKIMVVEIL